jgi:hypothetical protein
MKQGGERTARDNDRTEAEAIRQVGDGAIPNPQFNIWAEHKPEHRGLIEGSRLVHIPHYPRPIDALHGWLLPW